MHLLRPAHVIRPLIYRYARNSETNPAGLNETYYFNSFTGTRNTIRPIRTRAITPPDNF